MKHGVFSYFLLVREICNKTFAPSCIKTTVQKITIGLLLEQYVTLLHLYCIVDNVNEFRYRLP